MRYQYSSDGFKKDFYGNRDQFNFNIVNSIIVINIIIFYFTNPSTTFTSEGNPTNPYWLFFGVNSQDFRIWQLFTYMFLHANLIHLFFNMFLLWMFGKQIESVWGSQKFISYYLITGIGSGFFIWLLSDSITIGASGAIMAILFSYG